MLHHRQVNAGELSLHFVEGGSPDDFLDSLKFASESPRAWHGGSYHGLNASDRQGWPAMFPLSPWRGITPPACEARSRG